MKDVPTMEPVPIKSHDGVTSDFTNDREYQLSDASVTAFPAVNNSASSEAIDTFVVADELIDAYASISSSATTKVSIASEEAELLTAGKAVTEASLS